MVKSHVSMRRWIKLDPTNMEAVIGPLDLEDRGAYLSLFLASYWFCRIGSLEPSPPNINDPDSMRLVFGRNRRWQSLLKRLQNRGLVRIEGDGSVFAVTHRHAHWLREPMAPHVLDLLVERDGAKCKHCGCADNLTVDHVVPVAAGGGEWLGNYQLLCRPCNSSKGKRRAPKSGPRTVERQRRARDAKRQRRRRTRLAAEAQA